MEPAGGGRIRAHTLLAFAAVTQLFAATVEYTNHASFLTAAGSLTLVNFDNLTPGLGSMTGTEYAGLGLTVVQRDAQPINVVTATDGSFVQTFPQSLQSAPNAISSSAVPGAFFDDSKSDNFDFLFSHAVFAAGLWIGNTGPGTNVIEFLDSSNTVIASRTINGSEPGTVGSCPNCRIFYGIVGDVEIEEVRTPSCPIVSLNTSSTLAIVDVAFVSVI
jgi:hypothetical protein